MYPYLVCVGAQKCATSFLYSVLREHPKVTVAPKDTGTVTGDAPVVFEAGLIDQPDGPEQVAAINPDARILICTRDPIERAVSEYRMRVRQGTETRSLHEALMADEQSGLHAYLRRSRYHLDIPRWKATFERVLILSANASTRVNLLRLFLFSGQRDREALNLAANPPMRYAEISSAAAQREGMTPDQRRLHDAALHAKEAAGLRRYLAAPPRRA